MAKGGVPRDRRVRRRVGRSMVPRRLMKDGVRMYGQYRLGAPVEGERDKAGGAGGEAMTTTRCVTDFDVTYGSALAPAVSIVGRACRWCSYYSVIPHRCLEIHARLVSSPRTAQQQFPLPLATTRNVRRAESI